MTTTSAHAGGLVHVVHRKNLIDPFAIMHDGFVCASPAHGLGANALHDVQSPCVAAGCYTHEREGTAAIHFPDSTTC